ncbi:Permease OS=Castellaniella defragrans OX=75697 GN=HNR28_000636 PE=3 SV=1 [Castellaniella defragrans]
MTNDHPPVRHPIHPAWGVALFVLIALAGLFYVKWSPYYGRAFVAAQTHSIGSSILNGADGAIPAPSLSAALDYAIAYGRAIWQALLLGLLLGSAMQTLLPAHWVKRWLGGSGIGSVLTASLLSVPSMMCTCCSAPVVTGLRQCRAAPGSTAAYWLGNTMLNPATLVFMGFVLGWHWVGLRLVLGLIMVVGLGWLLNRTNRAMETPTRAAEASMRTPDGPTHAAEASMRAVAESTACPPPARSLTTVLLNWARAFTGMALRLLPEYLILVLLLGAARAWLFPMMDLGMDNSLLWIMAAAIAGMLFVIPTAGEVPIVQTLLAMGLAAGPAAALLLTLPPISLPSLAMVARSFQRRDLALLMLGVPAIGVLGGGLAVALGF